MRSLVRQRVNAASRLRCSSILYRLTPTETSRGGPGRPSSCCFPSIEYSSRQYSTTAVLYKQLPTSTGSSSSNAAAGASTSPLSRQGGRKQSQHVPASSAASSRNGASAAAAVEAELDTTPPTTIDAPAAKSSNNNTTAAAQHRTGKAATSSRAKSPRRGRRKQGPPVSPSGSAPTVRPTSAARKRLAEPQAATVTPPPPPVEPPMSSTHAAEGEHAPSSISTRAKRKSKGLDAKRRTRNAASTDSACARAEIAPEAAVSIERTRTAAASAPLPSAFGSTAPVYSTHNMLDTAPRTEQQRMAERCSITKLIMVSASVSFLFTALPRSEGQVKMFVRDMNRIQLPSPAMAANTPALTSKEFHELRQRLCAEQYATNTVFIHVREMEQLVPPLHLQASASSAAATNDANESSTAVPLAQPHGGGGAHDGKARSRRGRRSRSEDAAFVNSLAAPAAAPQLPTLSPVERLLALQAWKKAAASRARETQARYPIPAHFHAITRVRFHDPHQTDLTVAMGGGWSKSTDSVLRAIVRSMNQEERGDNGESLDSEGSPAEWVAGGEEDEDDLDGGLPPFPMPDSAFSSAEVVTEAAADLAEPEQPAFLASPYAVKPLLTVCASCVPRREAWIGTCSPKPSMAWDTAATGPISPYWVRRLPAVPRFSTRVTIMLEHDDMDPADLVSLAEMSTTRKPAAAAASRASMGPSAFDMHSDVSVKGGGVEVAGGEAADLSNASLGGALDTHTRTKRPVQLYCLVQDAGEY